MPLCLADASGVIDTDLVVTSRKESAVLHDLVVGVDGSPSGRRALEWAMGAGVDAVHAVHAVSPAMELLAASVQIDTRPYVEGVEAALEGEWTAGLRSGTAKLFTRVIEDSPPLALLRAAGASAADAIVVGVRGRESPPRMIGATTGQLVHLSDHPVVIVPEGGALPVLGATGLVVVAVGGRSDGDAELVGWADRVAGRSDARIEVVYAEPAAAAANGRSVAARLSSWLEGLGAVHRCRVQVVAADPISALVDASRGADLVVAGSHRSSRLAAYLTGALAHHLPPVSACPVALVPLSIDRP